MPRILSFSPKKYLVAAAIAVFIILGLPSGALAADDSTVAADNGNTQAADTGTAVVNPPATDPVPPVADPAPAVDTTAGAPVTTDTPPPDQPPATDNNVAADQTTTPAPDTAPVCPAPGQQGTASANSSPSSDANLNNNNSSSANNNICSQSTSGDATVTGSNTGGNATTGDASAVANILNVINSVTGLTGSQLKTFVLNYGDHFGDITITPELLDYVLSGNCGCGANLTLNSTTNSDINNDIYLGANSGNAGVSDNGSGGNATSGSATALLNLVNIINSMITSGQSFVGVINIYGNLDGDILLPPDILQSLLSGGGGGGGGPPGHTNLDLTNNQSINNNVNLSAQSGNASVSGNGQGGNATSGNASTQLKLYNLTGSQIIGKNALLVLVNVLGQWFGMIVNAPQGATSSLLGGGSGSCGCTGNLDASINNNSQINNNITLAAQSGDATVTGNSVGGNATTGDASASANIINIINSTMSFADWFGILIINVFGNWNGSFGIDTAAGELPVTPPTGGTTGGTHHKVKKAVHVTLGATTGYYGGGNGSDSNSNDDQDNSHIGGLLGLGTGGTPTAPEGSAVLGNLIVAAVGAACCFGLLSLLARRRNDKGQLEPAILPKIVYPEL